MRYDELLAARRAALPNAPRVEAKNATPSIRNLAQALTSARSALAVPVVSAAPSLWSPGAPLSPDEAAALARALDDAEAPALALAVGDSHETLARACAAAGSMPVLRADPLLEEGEVFATRALGADGVLLVARALGPRLGRLVQAARATHMLALVLALSPEEARAAEAAGAAGIALDLRDDVAAILPAIGRRAVVVGLAFSASRATVAAEEGRLDAILALVSAASAADDWRALTG